MLEPSLKASVWDKRHARAGDQGSVAHVLLRNSHLLPGHGRALDLACGRGANALWLARRGLAVQAWDYSSQAIDRLQRAARQQGLELQALLRDVVQQPPEPASFDLILVAHFLDRDLWPHIQAALKPGGLLCYQTFVRAVNLGRGPDRSEWRLAPNELLGAFPDLQVVNYHEDGLVGPQVSGEADLALLVAMKDV